MREENACILNHPLFNSVSVGENNNMMRKERQEGQGKRDGSRKQFILFTFTARESKQMEMRSGNWEPHFANFRRACWLLGLLLL
jgi:hypothetical protein